MEEITKHFLKISRTMGNPANSFPKKLKEIALEIFIIVFAVTLAQFLERQREENARQKEVKEFLLGLKNDMISDVDQAKSDIQGFNHFKKVYSYLSNVKINKKPNADSPINNVKEINNNTSLIPSTSRFEGFKSSGKLEEIEDKPLLQNILNFYEQAIPLLHASETGWLNFQHNLSDFFIENKIEYDDGNNNYYALITTPKAKNLCKMLIPWPEIYERHDKLITLGNTIIKEINEDYNPNE
jgi:hypothetical protein